MWTPIRVKEMNPQLYDVGSLAFVVALSGYDQCLVEDRNAVCVNFRL